MVVLRERRDGPTQQRTAVPGYTHLLYLKAPLQRRLGGRKVGVLEERGVMDTLWREAELVTYRCEG